jgi:hypothetical protein
MKILTSTNDLTISMNMEQDFKTDLGWEEGALQMEEQILSEIINPIENYETVRYIHKPYTSSLGVEQTDIWFSFYFLTGSTYVNDYEPTGLSNRENVLMLKQTVKSFFRLEFFKTPNGVKPERTNRKLVFAKNLSLPLGEKYFHTDFNDYIFLPVFMGSNYRNKENMYLFWFQDESPFSGTTITGNTFWMTAKFYNAEDGSISDFVNKPNFTDTFSDDRIGTGVTKSVIFYEKKSTDSITEYEDLYYKVTIDKNDYSYIIERDVQNDVVLTATPTPTPTPTAGGGGITNTPTPTPTPTPTTAGPTPTPTPTPTEPPIYTLQLGYDASERLTACSNYTNFNRTNVYSYTPFASIGQGTILYTGFTYPLTGYAPNGWYSDGDNGWIVYGGGSLNNETSCSITPTPTPTPTPLPGISYLVSTGQTFDSINEACSQSPSTIGTSGVGGSLYLNNITSPSVGNQLYTSQGCEFGTEYSGSGMNNYYFVYRNGTTWAIQIGVGGTITQLNNCPS